MVCNLCGIDKPLSCYSPCARNKSGYRYRCRECTNSSYEAAYSDKRRANYHSDKEKICEIERQKYRQSPSLNLWRSAKARAKKFNIPFDISVEDVYIPEECPILKVKLQIGDGKVSPYSPTLDRIIPELGYTRGNIQVVSGRANRMKSDASLSEMILFSEWIKSFAETYRAIEGPTSDLNN